MCSVCPLHNVEDLQHFALECPLYEDIRADIFSQIEYVFSSNHMGVKFEELSSCYKLIFMDMTSVQKWVKNYKFINHNTLFKSSLV
jgi:hypothetical protein